MRDESKPCNDVCIKGELFNIIESMYEEHKFKVQNEDGHSEEFVQRTGIRQGCPLSPLIFAVVADVLLRTITNKLADKIVILTAFADAAALILKDASSLEATFRIFAEYPGFSNLQLNFKKTGVIP